MARIQINDLPVLQEMKTDELKGIFGGFTVSAAQFYGSTTSTPFNTGVNIPISAGQGLLLPNLGGGGYSMAVGGNSLTSFRGPQAPGLGAVVLGTFKSN